MSTTEQTTEQLRARIQEMEVDYQKLQDKFDDEVLLSCHLAEYLARQNFELCREVINSTPYLSEEKKVDMMRHLQDVLDGYA